MIQCKQCGANLPEDARFCLQCGTSVEILEQPAATAAPLDFVQPALAGGMFLGLLSSIPIIAAGNCLCCLWIIGGGGLAAFLLSKQRPVGLTYGDGAFVGVLSGVFGAVVGTVISIPIQIISLRIFGSQQQAVEQFIRDMGFQGPIPDWMLQVASPEVTVTKVAFTLLGNLIFYSLFAMIGGILGVAVLQKQKSQSH